MSAALVKQSLAVVDEDFQVKGTKKNIKTDAAILFPQHHKSVGKLYKKGKKAEKIGLAFEKKISIQEAKRQYKSKQDILKENLEKLELIRNSTLISLKQEHTEIIFERARINRPVEKKVKKSKKSKSIFTEEDFKKFEEEYFS